MAAGRRFDGLLPDIGLTDALELVASLLLASANIAQGLKPAIFAALGGTTQVVP